MQTLTQLDSFTRAYLTTALWSSNDESDEQGGEPMDRNYSQADFAPATLEKMAADCARFQAEQSETIQAAIDTGEVRFGPDFDAIGRAGHDFWLTRNGHGCGFWDGDWPEPMADTLSAAARAFGPCDLYVGDDGKIHC